jgi:hypothetical protein
MEYLAKMKNETKVKQVETTNHYDRQCRRPSSSTSETCLVYDTTRRICIAVSHQM